MTRLFECTGGRLECVGRVVHDQTPGARRDQGVDPPTCLGIADVGGEEVDVVGIARLCLLEIRPRLRLIEVDADDLDFRRAAVDGQRAQTVAEPSALPP